MSFIEQSKRPLEERPQEIPSRRPIKKTIVWSAILALSPSLLLVFANSFVEHTSFLFAAPFFYIFLLPIILLIALYPSFSANKQRWIWLFFVIAIPILVIGSFSIISYLGAQGGGGALYAVLLILLLAPLSLFIVYAILTGYILRKVLYSTQKKQFWLGTAVLIFFFPFLMWYGAPPVLKLLGDGLTSLSSLLMM